MSSQTQSPQEAEALLRRAIQANPGAAGPYARLADLLYGLGRPIEALSSFERAVALDPSIPEVWYNRALALRDSGRLEEALASLDRAIALRPALEHAHTNRGVVLRELKRPQEALLSFEAAIRINSAAIGALYNRGHVLRDLGRPEEALASYEAVVRLQPQFPGGHNGLGIVLHELWRCEEAVASFDRAIALAPGFAEALNNRGLVLHDLRRLDEARASFDAAIAADPTFVNARFNRSLTKLAEGDLAAGFEEYRWRLKAVGPPPASRAQSWEGEPLCGRSILVHCEQGLGDSLHFVRYARLLAAKGARVAVGAPEPLVRLFRSIPGIEVSARPDRDSFDFQIPLMCLPRLFGTTLATVPAEVPYLTADPIAAEQWGGRLRPWGGLFKVGLVWAGNSHRHVAEAHAVDRRRSLSLARLAPLAAASGVQFFSLQKGEPSLEAAHPPPGLALVDFTEDLADFADTAALAVNLDLVITVDTSVAHLAGALARPVWILSRYDGCWRWLNGREDSPWYPTARLFHQPAPGQWDEVIERVADALVGLASGRAGHST